MAVKNNTILYKKHIGITPTELKEKNRMELIAVPLALFLMGNTIWFLMQSKPTKPFWNHKNGMYMPYKAAIHNAYIPTDKYIVDENTYKTGQLTVNPNPKFKAHGTWLANLIISLLFFAGFAYGNKELKRDFDTVDMMVDLEKFGKDYNLNAKQVKKLLKKSEDIIVRMSKENATYFDMIINGKVDITKDKVFVDMAVAILDGYLSAHPEETAGVLSVFTENKPVVSKLKAKLANRGR